MTVERARVIPLFKEIHLFAGLDEGHLSKAARYFKEVTYDPNQVIFKQGGPGEAFYIIQDGEVSLSVRLSNTDSQVDVLTAGDFFGAEAMLYRTPQAATAKALGYVTLLAADRRQFTQFLTEFPQVQTHLERLIQARRFVRSHPFSWLNEDEVVYQVRRKHIAYLLITLIIPMMVVLLGLAILGASLALTDEGLVQTGGLISGGVVLGFGVLYSLWQWIDWSNDYYIVTNQRVVWIERVIFLYASMIEAPLDDVRGINVGTTLLGRILGYGDVVVTTYTTEVVLRHVSEPRQMEAVIREYLQRVQRMSVEAQRQETEREIERILGRTEEETEPEPEPPPSTTLTAKPPPIRKPAPFPGDVVELSFSERVFGNLFRLRSEKEGVITYRKHFLELLKKTWAPDLLLLVMFSIFVASVYLYAQAMIDGGTLAAITGGLFLVSIPVLIWWLYNYLDWSNDIYQITRDTIYDIERKPLGSESSTSAPLDKVITLRHERRGIIGYILNVGDVIVNAGDTKLTFEGVYQPARVQQDVFQRIQELKQRRKQEEVSRERDRILDLLEIYHQKLNGGPTENETEL